MGNDASTDQPSASTDSFGRLRVSSPIAQFEYQNQYNKGPLLWSETVSSTGTVAHQANSATVLLSTGGTASGAKAINVREYY